MSGTKLAFAVAAGVVMGGFCLCGIGSFLIFRKPPPTAEQIRNSELGKAPKGTAQYAEAQAELLSQLKQDPKLSRTCTFTEAFVSVAKPAIVNLPPNTFSVWAAPSGETGPVVLDAGKPLGEVAMEERGRLSVADLNDWSGQLVIQIRGSQSARLLFISDNGG